MNIIKIFVWLDKNRKKHKCSFSLQPRTVVCNTLNHMIYMQCDLVIFIGLHIYSMVQACFHAFGKTIKCMYALYITYGYEQNDLSII